MKIELGKDNIGTYLQVDNSVYYVKDSEGNFILNLNFPYKHNRQFRYNTPREEYIHKNNWREKLDPNSPIMKIIKRFPEAEHEFVEYESGDKELIVKINPKIFKNMKTKVPKIKIENGELQIEGAFNFELSPTIITEEFIPIKKITFDWCVEISQSELMTFGEDKILEMFGEKLKQDFIKFSKSK